MFLLTAVVLLLLIFIVSGVQKALGYVGRSDFSPKEVAKYLSVVSGIPTALTAIALFIAVAIELLAPPAIIASLVLSKAVVDSPLPLAFGLSLNHLAYLGVLGLILFTVLATLAYHFPTDPAQQIPFMKNLSIIGGLILLAREYAQILPQPPFPALI
jgi:uncharacterized membrane protein YphA (DoxX/SURF4 family)